MPEKIKVTNRFMEMITTGPQRGMPNPIFQQVLNKQLPVKVSYWLARAFDKCDSELKTFRRRREEIIKEHAELDERGEVKTKKINGCEACGRSETNEIVWLKESGGEKAVSEKIDEILDLEVEIDVKPIVLDFDELERKGISFSPQEMRMILPFIDDKGV